MSEAYCTLITGKILAVGANVVANKGEAPARLLEIGLAATQKADLYLPFREALAMLTGDVAAQQSAGRIAPENTNFTVELIRSLQEQGE